ncbi:MAG TPA: Rrf2 family transcriptional regulator [Phycisphaerae bacterium]|nr:Rrf2 family transcriptional regulator [Phycisphaerae bacterium]HNU45598.1 Rrf2 family transcriptional regulator [Phycisphaerae bacterium]
MLTLTKRTDYALNAALHLSRHPGKVSSAREIATRYRLPLPLITNILKTLTRAGVVASTRGAHGGYRLARPAEQITLHDLIVATEGPYQLVRCMEPAEDGIDACVRQGFCPVRGPVRRIHERVKEFLCTVTLAELANGNGPAPPLIREEPAAEACPPASITEVVI